MMIVHLLFFYVIFFFFKQKTAYEMRIRDWVQTCALPIYGLAGLPGITVIRNPSNLGYTRSINKGCELAANDDVVLLNSDTVVGPHWLRNLKVAAYGNDRIGTVTAISDNAGALDRKGVRYGKEVSVRVALGGSLLIKKKK